MKIGIDKDVKDKLLKIRNENGFLDLNHTIKYLLDNDDLKKNIDSIIRNALGQSTEEILTTKMPDNTIPIVVPKPNAPDPTPPPTFKQKPENPNVKEVSCPQCTHKFMADITKPVKCPVCGLEGKSE